MNIEERVFSYIEKYNMIEAGSQVIVGISGGGNFSVCLLFLLSRYQKKEIFSFTGGSCKSWYPWAGGFRRDQEYARELCERLGVPFTVYTYSVPDIAGREKRSLEETGKNGNKGFCLKSRKSWGKRQWWRLPIMKMTMQKPFFTILFAEPKWQGLGGRTPGSKDRGRDFLCPAIAESHQGGN